MALKTDNYMLYKQRLFRLNKSQKTKQQTNKPTTDFKKSIENPRANILNIY